MKKSVILTGLSLAVGLIIGGASVSANTITVQAGDTISEIAYEHGTSVSDIVNENSLSNPNLIFVGDKLQVNGNTDAANQTTKASTQVPTVKTEQPAKEQTQPTVTGNKAVNYSSAESQTQSVQPQQSSQSSQSSLMSKTSGQLSQSEINQVAGAMSSRTGESQATWSMIINRESKGNVDIYNSENSGAFGLFQQMKSTHGDVNSQINEAVQLYKVQGIQAWQ